MGYLERRGWPVCSSVNWPEQQTSPCFQSYNLFLHHGSSERSVRPKGFGARDADALIGFPRVELGWLINSTPIPTPFGQQQRLPSPRLAIGLNDSFRRATGLDLNLLAKCYR
jgi:hypothetical protein